MRRFSDLSITQKLGCLVFVFMIGFALFGALAYRTLEHVEVTGPYLFVKTAGPARLGITDIGLSFTPNGARGVLVQFKEKVQGTGPFRLLKHPEVTLGVEKPETLAALLDQR